MRITSRVRKGLFAVAAVVAAFVGYTMLPSTGADFNDSQQGSITAETAVLTMSVNDDPTEQFSLAFGNIKPGDTKTATFTVKNTGTIAGKVSVDQPVSNLVVPALSAADLAEMKIGVAGYAAPAPITSLASGIELGTLNAGQQRTYTVTLSLDSSAGNEWQDKQLAATFTAWLKQS